MQGPFAAEPYGRHKCLKVQGGNPDPFSAEEVEAILNVIASHVFTQRVNRRRHCGLFEFAFSLGFVRRADCAFGVTWIFGQVITIRRARVLKR
jgi:hypothetical protein